VEAHGCGEDEEEEVGCGLREEEGCRKSLLAGRCLRGTAALFILVHLHGGGGCGRKRGCRRRRRRRKGVIGKVSENGEAQGFEGLVLGQIVGNGLGKDGGS